MEQREAYATDSVSLPSPRNIDKASISFVRASRSKDANPSSPATTTLTTEKSTEGGGPSTIRSGLNKLTSSNGNRKKAFTRLGSQNDCVQTWEEQPLPSADSKRADAGGIFSVLHRSNTCGATAASSILRRGGSEVVAGRIDGPSTRNEVTSNGASLNSACSDGDARQAMRPAELAMQQSFSAHAPLLEELDSFDEDDNDDEHFHTQSTVSSPSATATGAGTGIGTNWQHGVPPRPTVLDVDSPRLEGDGGGTGGALTAGIEDEEGSYDLKYDLSLSAEGTLAGIESAGATTGATTNPTTSNSARRKANSFELGTVVEDDPSTKLIAGFLRRQTESGSNFLDLDMAMDELAPVTTRSEAKKRYPIPACHVKEQPTPATTPSPNSDRDSIGKDSTYLGFLGHPPETTSVPTSFKGEAASSPNSEESVRWTLEGLKDQTMIYQSDPLALPSDARPPDVKINIGEGDILAKSSEEAARVEATTRTPSRANDVGAAVESPSSAGVRWRRNSTFRPNSSPGTPKGSGEEEVMKAPAKYAVRPTFSRLKSRLADVPKPAEMTKASGAIDDRKMSKIMSAQVRNSRELKSSMMGNKLKKVEEEEEDPLKVTDLPEKYRKRDKGLWTILQVSALLIILAGLACVLSFPTLRRTRRGGLLLWKWVLLALVVLCGRLISKWIVWVLVFMIEKNFLLRKRVVYFVYALRKGVQNCLWLGFALLTWRFMIGPRVDNNWAVVRYITKVLVCFLVAAFIVLIKTLIVKVFASSFHVNNYFERIQEALFNQFIMETLAGPPMIEYEQDLEDEKRLKEEIAGLRDAGASGPSLSAVKNLPPVGGVPPRPSLNTKSAMLGAQNGAQQNSGVIGRSEQVDEKKKKLKGSKAELNSGISVDHLQKLDISNISAWNMKRLIHIIRNSTLTHSLEESVNSADGVETEIQSEWQAKSAAKQIFKNVAKPGLRVLTEDDLLRFMHEEETKKAFNQFDGAAETKCITKQALKKWVIEVYKERRALAFSLNDTKTAVNKLHRMIDVVVAIIIIVIWLLVLGIATTKLLLFLSSQILLLILVWGNTLKTVFEAIVFLFVMHPFDVGDRCVVDGMQLVVEEMNILTTVFLGDFNVKVWFPNSVLATKPIQNFYRSPEMGDAVDIIVQASTPVERIAAFKEKIGRYIEGKLNHWHPDFALNLLQMSEGERLKLSLGLKHTMNYQNMGEIVKRRSELLNEVNLYLQELGIEYHVPAHEVHITQRKEV